MCVYGEVCVEHLARRADGDVERDPVSRSSGELVIDLKIRQPFRDRSSGFGRGLDERVNLYSI